MENLCQDVYDEDNDEMTNNEKGSCTTVFAVKTYHQNTQNEYALKDGPLTAFLSTHERPKRAPEVPRAGCCMEVLTETDHSLQPENDVQ